MAHPQIAVFARLAEGGQPPVRRIQGQKTLLGRAVHAIVYNEIHDEIVFPQGFAQAILTFRGAASGEEPPIRVIHGSRTQLQAPDPVTVDPINNEIFVPEDNRVLVFAREANGNVAPIRVLRVPEDTRLGITAVFPAHNLFVVSGRASRGEGRDQMLIFDRRAQGDAKPVRVISGPRTMLDQEIREIRAYRDWIVVAHSIDVNAVDVNGETLTDRSASLLSVWSIHDQGDVSPRWSMNLGKFDGVPVDVKSFDLDPKNRTIIVATGRKPNNAVLTYSFPELFEARAGSIRSPVPDERSIAERVSAPAGMHTLRDRLWSWLAASSEK